MNDRVKHLADEARKLSPEEQSELVDLLLAMMRDALPPLGEDWDEEIRRRVAEIDRGEVELQDFDQAIQALRAGL
jgi:hypothetical protein